MAKPKTLGALLFPDFELLDLCGPLEMFGHLKGVVDVVTVAERKGPVQSTQGPEIVAGFALDDCPPLDLLLVPGGFGTRGEVENERLIAWLAERVRSTEITTSVCTGSALLARAGVLDGRRATTNTRVFDWVASMGPRVQWVKQARWVEDGKFYTSSGVSAGIDMALAVIARIAGPEVSEQLAIGTEYEWHRDSSWDPFAVIHGLVSSPPAAGT
jgi:transcriptional regulator GlxA family with amidase domain